ncbi:hypothetical protein [Streptomyces sp. bgisy154]|uniref:hypothetical protein n=1 Tax=Streptomyces sp. bgisy154 TaxID=3413794 RepID=UPI003D7532EF
MAQQSWPYTAYNSGAVTDDEYEILAARHSDDGVYGSPSDTAVVSAGAGLSVDVRAGVYASLRGHGWESGATAVNLAISANSSGSTRVDWVVLRLDRSTWTVAAAVREGTAGAGAPSLVQDVGDYTTGVYEIPLAQVTVEDGAAAVTVTRAELYVGARIRPCTSTTRNLAPVRGEMAWETDTSRMLIYTGTAWRTVYQDSGPIVINQTLGGWEIQADSVLEVRNGVANLRFGYFQRVGSLGMTARLPLLVPAQYRHPTRDQYAVAYITGLRIGRVQVYSNVHGTQAGQAWLTSAPSLANGDAVLPTNISWVVDN